MTSPGQYGSHQYQSPETRALAGITAESYDKDQAKTLIKLKNDVGYMAAYMRKLQKEVDQANENFIQQIQSFIADFVVLLGGGSLTTIDFGDLRYVIQAIGALLGFQTVAGIPIPINLFTAAWNFFGIYIAPTAQFADVINELIDAAFAIIIDAFGEIPVFGQAIQQLAAWLIEIRDALWPLVDTVFLLIDTLSGQPGTEADDVLMGLFHQIMDMLIAAPDVLLSVLDALIDLLLETPQILLSLLNGLIQMLIDSPELLDTLLRALVDLILQIPEVLEQLLTGLIELLLQVPNLLFELLDALITLLTASPDVLARLITGIIELLVNLPAELLQLLESLVGLLIITPEILADLTVAVADNLGDLIGIDFSGFDAFLNSIVDGIAQLFNFDMSTGLDANSPLNALNLFNLVPGGSIPELDASKITSGFFADIRVPGLANRLLTNIFNARAIAGSNLVISPSFDDPTIYRFFGSWPNDDGVAGYSTEQSRSGTHSWKMTCPTGTVEGSNIWLYLMPHAMTTTEQFMEDDHATGIKVNPGEKFYVESWVFPNTTNTAEYTSVAIGFTLADSSGVNPNLTVQGSNIDDPTRGVWNKVSGYVTIPAGYDLAYPYAEAYISADVSGTTPYDSFYYDDVIVREETVTQNIIQQLYNGPNILNELLIGNLPTVDSKITAVDASKILTGQMNQARVNITAIAASIVSGVFGNAQIPKTLDNTWMPGAFEWPLVQIPTVDSKITTVDASKILTGQMNQARVNITSIAASIVSGVFANTQIPKTLDNTWIPSAVWPIAQIPTVDSKITSVDASKVLTGQMAQARVNITSIATSILSGTVDAVTQLSGIVPITSIPTVDSKISVVDASKVTTGQMAQARVNITAIAASIVTGAFANTQIPKTLDNSWMPGVFEWPIAQIPTVDSKITVVDGSKITTGQIAQARLNITSIAAGIVTGTFANTQIPKTLDNTWIPSAVWPIAQIPTVDSKITSVDGSKILSGNIDNARIPGMVPWNQYASRGSNLATDPSFDNSVGLWPGNAGQLSTTYFHSGGRSVKLVGTGVVWGAGTSCNLVYDQFNVVPVAAKQGDKFYVECYIYGAPTNVQTTGPSGFSIGGDGLDFNGAFVGGGLVQSDTTTAKNGVWTKVSGYVTFNGAGLSKINFYARLEANCNPGEQYWIDDVIIREVTEPQNLVQQLYGGTNLLANVLIGNLPTVDSKITAVDASKILTGQMAQARVNITSIATSILSGTIDAVTQLSGTVPIAQIPTVDSKITSVDGSKILSGNIADARVPGLANRALQSILESKAIAGANLCVDPGFDNPAVWVAEPGVMSTAQSVTGGTSRMLVSDGNLQSISLTAVGGPGTGKPWMVRPGAQYYLEASVFPKSTNVGGGSIGVLCSVWDSTGVNSFSYVFQPYYGAPPAKGQWTTYSGFFTIPAGYDGMIPYVLQNGTPVGDSFYFDRIVIKEATRLGNSPDLQAITDNITQYIFGLDAGSNVGITDARNALDTHWRTTQSTAQKIADMESESVGAAQSGVSVRVTFSDHPNSAQMPNPAVIGNPGLGGWVTTYTGAGTSSLGVNNGGTAWTLVNNGNRVAVTHHPVPTNTDYQKLNLTVSSGPTAPNSAWLVGRCNAANTEYIGLRVTNTGFLAYAAELGWVNAAGTFTRWAGPTALPTSVDSELWIGTGLSARQYQYWMAGKKIFDVTEPGTSSLLDANHRFWGIRGDVDGSHANAAATFVGAADNKPPDVVGSGCRVTRTSATQVNFAAGATSTDFPASYFDTVREQSSDITPTLANGRLTVTREGWYMVSVSVEITGSNSARLGLGIKKNGVLYAMGSGTYSSALGVQATFIIYLNAGEYVNACYANTDISQWGTRGQADGSRTFLSMSLLNRSYA